MVSNNASKHVPVKRKRGRLVKDGCLINNNVVEIVSSNAEKGESLVNTRMVDVDIQKKGKNEKKDFNDKEPITFSRSKKKPRSSLSKSHAFCLIDEDSDEEFVNNKSFIQDEMDELDDFIDDEDASDDDTDDENNDDDF
ncbi:hypothetical protein Tco_1406938 [Tanacetum coccineum]